LQTLDSLTAKVVPIEAGAHVIGAAFLGDVPALALGDGGVLIRAGAQAPPRRVEAHPEGSILVAASDGGRLVTGGDDGHVVRVGPDGSTETIADEKGRWIDALVARPDGALAWSAGKAARARDAKGRVATFDAPSSVRGLGFAPKGYRLVVAHYNGASLWFPSTEAKPDLLEWKGSHLDATWAPSGRFVVTTMQENGLHGWTLPGREHMRMSGYPAKTRSVSWSHDGLWLATSGADALIVWPFQGERGPMGKAPRECGVRRAKVTRVAFHPGALIVAAGYEDGCILLCRLTDASELLVRPEEPEAGAVTALAWDAAGLRMLFGTAEGAAGLLTLPVG